MNKSKECAYNIPSFINTVEREGLPSLTPFGMWCSGTISFTPKASVPSTFVSSVILTLTVLALSLG